GAALLEAGQPGGPPGRTGDVAWGRVIHEGHEGPRSKDHRQNKAVDGESSMRRVLPFFLLVSLVSFVDESAAADPCQSGLKPGQKPGPYSAFVATGPERGQLHCYICEAEDRPVVIVFARSLTDPLGKLAHELDKALTTHKKTQLRG